MAITKNSSKSESWTIRIPNELATAARSRYAPGTGNTQIVIEAIKCLLGIDYSLPNSVSNDDLTAIKLELDEIRSRLSTLEKQNINESVTISDKPAVDQGWMNIATIANELRVKPKSISGAASRRGEPVGNDIIKFDMSGKTIHKKGSGLTALYQIQ